MNLVKTLQRVVLMFTLLSLLGSAGVAPFCASCGPKAMDCCKGDPSKAESLSQSPCCDFQMSVTVEPHPARMSSPDSQRLQDEAQPVSFHVATRASAEAVHPEWLASSESPGSDTSPPLFLLNESFRC